MMGSEVKFYLFSKSNNSVYEWINKLINYPSPCILDNIRLSIFDRRTKHFNGHKPQIGFKR